MISRGRIGNLVWKHRVKQSSGRGIAFVLAGSGMASLGYYLEFASIDAKQINQ